MWKFLHVATWLIFSCLPLVCKAETPSANLVQVKFGANSVDFTGDGVPDLVVLGHRENFNAHSFDVASFYILADAIDGTKRWNIVPVMEKNKERLEVTFSGGADCVLHDFRLLAGSGKSHALLILADRDMGTSFIHPGTVTFTYFSLTSNTDRTPGFPRFAFDRSHVTKSKAHYCDVEAAFQKELGIGTYAQ